jgi:hypothetical protein
MSPEKSSRDRARVRVPTWLVRSTEHVVLDRRLDPAAITLMKSA